MAQRASRQKVSRQKALRRTASRLTKLAGGVALAIAIPMVAPVVALVNSVGEAGIDALRLHQTPFNITGAKIAIGQVEIGRPARYRLDKIPQQNRVVRVDQVFRQDNPPLANELVDGHATNVASVMISQDKRLTGVAPDARLYSSAVGALRRGAQPEECLASQTVAQQNGGDVRAINFSFGEPLARDPRPEAMLDGDALLTQCIDWSSNEHGVLYVIAGNQGRGGIPIPTDLFNGLTVANSVQVDGAFTKVDFSSLGSEPEVIIGRREELESNVGPRRSISLVAPGSNLTMVNPDGSTIRASGTSFAAPHVTATVALLQEYGDRQLQQNRPDWSLDSRNPQVAKAVMLNAADKIEDDSSGQYLGMSRTLRTPRNQTWLDSDAYLDDTRPLSADLGTGHLNAYRAYEQFSAGQQPPSGRSPDGTLGDPVSAQGWDYRTVAEDDAEDETGMPAYRDYVIDESLQAGSFVSITLAWSRKVTLNDLDENSQYDLGESFENHGLNDLNLYLLPADEDDTDDSVWQSVSEVDSVEHIFQQIPETGRYKIRVVYEAQVNDAVQPYALAWWAAPSDSGAAPSPELSPELSPE
ncbi:MAG: S8 family serine peptidase [Elainellaceae cyanobacterium]